MRLLMVLHGLKRGTFGPDTHKMKSSSRAEQCRENENEKKKNKKRQGDKPTQTFLTFELMRDLFSSCGVLRIRDSRFLLRI